MTQTAQHTPGPWRVCTAFVDPEIVSDHATPLTIESIVQFKGQQNALANAAFIVRACNSHERLLAALTGAVKTLAALYGEAEAHDSQYLNALREIVAEATANQPQPATDRPGDQAAVMHEETGIDYATCLVMCNMD
jgi:hypothetical protein